VNSIGATPSVPFCECDEDAKSERLRRKAHDGDAVSFTTQAYRRIKAGGPGQPPPLHARPPLVERVCNNPPSGEIEELFQLRLVETDDCLAINDGDRGCPEAALDQFVASRGIRLNVLRHELHPLARKKLFLPVASASPRLRVDNHLFRHDDLHIRVFFRLRHPHTGCAGFDAIIAATCIHLTQERRFRSTLSSLSGCLQTPVACLTPPTRCDRVRPTIWSTTC